MSVITTRDNQTYDWAVDVPETIVRANFKRSQKILWDFFILPLFNSDL